MLLLRNVTYVRAGAMGAATVHISMMRRRELLRTPWQLVSGVLRLLLQAGLAVAQAFVMWALVHQLLIGHLGFRNTAASDGLAVTNQPGSVRVKLRDCLMDETDDSCAKLHKVKANFDILRATVCDVQDLCPGPVQFLGTGSGGDGGGQRT